VMCIAVIVMTIKAQKKKMKEKDKVLRI
jgi:hypothetical protein